MWHADFGYFLDFDCYRTFKHLKDSSQIIISYIIYILGLDEYDDKRTFKDIGSCLVLLSSLQSDIKWENKMKAWDQQF